VSITTSFQNSKILKINKTITLITNSGISQHFYRRLNASKSARIERREDSKTHSVAEKMPGKMVIFW